MTQPAQPNGAAAPALPTIEVTPFSQVAMDLAVPKAAEPAPQAAPDATDQRAPPPPAEASEAASEVAPAAEQSAAPSKLEEAEAAAARIVAKRRAQREARQTSDTALIQREQENAQLRQRLEQESNARQRIEADPIAALMARGMTREAAEKALTQRAIEENSIEGRQRRLEQENAELRRRLDQRDQIDQNRDQQQARTANERQFIETATVKEGDAHAFPALARAIEVFGADDVVRDAYAAIEADRRKRAALLAAQGKRWSPPSDADLHEYLNWRYAKLASAPSAAAPAGSQAAIESPAAKEAEATPTKKPAAAGPRTLSTRRAGPASAPKSYGEMNEAERHEWAASQLRKKAIPVE